ncbi:LysM peptidoglycan-binding domain-containing protein [Phaeobacter sp. C3_T13_0]|uniref:LysM peptidoglycan-binding domain-containing protein n=1 Tax=Phaeobacter cretensis TaxID=3342641 RepID=UPI0039BC79B3
MTDVTGKGGLSTTAIGGVAAVVVVLGGVVFLQWGGSDETRTPGVKTADGDRLVISPSAPADGKLASPNVMTDAANDAPAEETATAPVAEDVATDSSEAETVAAESVVEEAATSEPTAEIAAEEIAAAAALAEAVQETEAETLDSTPEAATDIGAAESPEVTGLSAPQMDLARFEMDGSGMVAGRAMPGSVVSLMLDGAVIEQLTVPSDGSFVVFTNIAPSAQPQVISLEAVLGDEAMASDAQFILAPVTPVQVAEATTETEVQAPLVEPQTDATDPAIASVDTPTIDTSNVETAGTDTDIAVTSVKNDVAVVASESPTNDVDSADVASSSAEAAPNLPEITASLNAADAVGKDPGAADTGSDVDNNGSSTTDTAAPNSDVTVADNTANEAEVTPEPEPTGVATAANPEPAEARIAAVAGASPDPQPEPQPDTEVAPQPTTSEQTAPQQVAVLRADASGVTLVQPATPTLAEVPDSVALDTISYDDEGAVVLSGRVRSDTVVRAYLDNSAVADLPVDEDGRWSGILPDVAPGIYALRLDAVDTDGKVLSRLETPFKREAPEVLQQPAAEPATTPDAAPIGAQPLVRLVTVQEGDTLWAISRERYGDGFLYVRVFDANRASIRNPDLIYPGQVFTVPVQ